MRMVEESHQKVPPVVHLFLFRFMSLSVWDVWSDQQFKMNLWPCQLYLTKFFSIFGYIREKLTSKFIIYKTEGFDSWLILNDLDKFQEENSYVSLPYLCLRVHFTNIWSRLCSSAVKVSTPWYWGQGREMHHVRWNILFMAGGKVRAGKIVESHIGRALTALHCTE